MSELKHYGVLGMRWGRRKQKSTYDPDELKKKHMVALILSAKQHDYPSEPS